MGSHRNPEHGESNQSKGQHQNADDIVVKVSPRSIETPDVEQGRENNQEDNVGIQRDLRQAREQAQNHAAHEEDDGIRNPETLRKRSEPSDQEHKKEKNELEVVNANGLHGGALQKQKEQIKSAAKENRRFLPSLLERSAVPVQPRANPLDGCRSKAGCLGMLLLGLRKTLLENVETNGGFLLIDDERWRQSQGSFSAAQ